MPRADRKREPEENPSEPPVTDAEADGARAALETYERLVDGRISDPRLDRAFEHAKATLARVREQLAAQRRA